MTGRSDSASMPERTPNDFGNCPAVARQEKYAGFRFGARVRVLIVAQRKPRLMGMDWIRRFGFGAACAYRTGAVGLLASSTEETWCLQADPPIYRNSAFVVDELTTKMRSLFPSTSAGVRKKPWRSGE